MKRVRVGVIAVALGCAIWAARGNRDAHPERSDPQGLEIAKLTRDLSPGNSIAVLNLDAISRNLRKIQKQVGPQFALRWVAKSLPSPQLLEWVARTSGSRRFMAFHSAMVPEILRKVPDADILMGKPIPVSAAETVLRSDISARTQVRWLVDSGERLKQYEVLAAQLRTPLRVALEIDVGLRRGGFASATDFEAAVRHLVLSSQNPEGLRFAGLMGYDGHVSHADPLLGPGKERAARREFESVQNRYREFVEILGRVHPSWMKDAVFDGGGSHTYWRYAGTSTPINELALGSALLKPAHFDDSELGELEAASFLVVPILKKVQYPFPFVTLLWPWVSRAFPEAEYGFYLYGSTWGGKVIWPPGLRDAWFHATGIQNLYPNQQLLMGPQTVAAGAGDRVVVRPNEGDTIAAFDSILALQEGEAPKQWTPVAHRN